MQKHVASLYGPLTPHVERDKYMDFYGRIPYVISYASPPFIELKRMNEKNQRASVKNAAKYFATVRDGDSLHCDFDLMMTARITTVQTKLKRKLFVLALRCCA